MKNKIIILQLLFVLFSCAPVIYAQKAVDQIFTKSTTQIISLNDKNLAAKSTKFNHALDLGEYGVYDLSLEQTYLFSDSYIARRANKNNDDSKLPLTFKGTIQGQPNTTVSLTTNDGFLSGFIETGKDVIFFEPYKNFDTNAVENELIIYYQKDVIDQEHSCAAHHTDKQTTHIESQNDQLKNTTTGCYEAEMVLVADYGMYQKHGNNTLNHITSVLNNVANNYDTEFNDPITFTVVDNYIATSSTMDLWTNTTDAPALLEEFRDSDFTDVTYDLASLWVTRNIWDIDDQDNVILGVVGIAYTPGACTSRCNLIEDYSSTAADLRVTFAHEIGHNFGAGHDAPGSGTIMTQGANDTNTWSPQSRNLINNFYPKATCLCASGDAADLNFKSCGGVSYNVNTLSVNNLQIQNYGTVTADNVKTRWYLSTDNTIDTTNDHPITEVLVSYDPGSFSTHNFTVDLSTVGIPPGNYYLGVITDYDNTVAEFSEDNNIGCISSSPYVTVTATPPDLRVLSICSYVQTGTLYSYSTIKVENSGNTNASVSTLGVYLSEDNTVNTSDHRIATASVPSIDANATSAFLSVNFNTATVTGVPSGNYFLGFVADADNNVIESNENNNSGCVTSSASINIVGTGCVTNYTIPTNHTTNEHIEASNSITSQKIVPNGLTVSYDAGVRVHLKDGFHAQSGSAFHAYIDGCAANKEETVDESTLLRNYPNPFTGQTTIEFKLSKDTPVTLFVSDMTGKQIAVLLNNDEKTEGTHSVTFDGNNYPAGMYYYTIHAGEYYDTQKMILAK